MPKPTSAQLRKINKFSQVELKEDQVYVFRSLSADTLPVARYGWFGEYSINMTKKMLQKLKKDYQTGVGLLASHNSYRLPFGRTFDAEVLSDEMAGSEETVDTLYIDHYMVTYMEDGDGHKSELPTEIGMTTKDISNHIEVGHTFDTSIGFRIINPKCSVCKNDLHDWEKCKHIPGLTYEVEGEEVRCDIIADTGEGVENSLVYAGAVNRAIIQKASKDDSSEEFSNQSAPLLQASVKFGDTDLYNVDDVKNLPLGTEILCFLSKGDIQMYTTTPERRNFLETEKGSVEDMSGTNQTSTVAEQLADVVLKSEHDAALAAKDAEITGYLSKISELEGNLQEANSSKEALEAKASLADQFTADLIADTVKAGVASRGNAFNADRFEKYLRTLSVEEIKEEYSALKEEFSGSIEAAAQVTESNTEGRDEAPVQMSAQEMREEAAKVAMSKFRKEGGNLEELTRQALEEIKSKQTAE